VFFFRAEVAATPKNKQNENGEKNAMKTKIIMAAKKWEYEYCCSSYFFLGLNLERGK